MDSVASCFPPSLGLMKLEAYLPAESPWRFCLEPVEKGQGQLLDTFDEKLLQSDRLLLRLGDYLLLIDLAGGSLVVQHAQKIWKFAAELAEGPVREILAGLTTLRAFVPVADLRIQWQHGALRDDEAKAGVWVNYLRLGRGRRTVRLFLAETLRGYDQARDELVEALSAAGAQPGCQVAGLYNELRIPPRNYSAKPEIPMQAEAPAGETAVLISAALLRVVRANEEGIIADYDTEFLHDYRVSLRKVRSLLSLFKGVFDPGETRRLQTECAALMQETNRLRDLDVYLLEQAVFHRLVPPDIAQGLAVLFAHIAEERRRAYAVVCKVLHSSRYRKRIVRLEKLFTDGKGPTPGPAGQEPSLAFAGRLVMKRYRKVCRIARQIDQNTADEIIHQLRIQCKKLRYIIEFFTPLFAKGEVDPIIKPLKRLQDNLGNFNDASVQQHFLGDVLTTSLDRFSGREIMVAQAVGALRAMLHQRQREERALVEENFMSFDSAETRATLRQLFPSEGL
jgi:CHAD domain-containing protein